MSPANVAVFLLSKTKPQICWLSSRRDNSRRIFCLLLNLFVVKLILAVIFSPNASSANIKNMKIKIFAISFFLILFSLSALAQQNLKRVTVKTERAKLGLGGSVTIAGAPEGSISIEAWQKPEIEVTAEIEVQAQTEADLALLATVNNFVIDADVNHVRLITTGMHDKEFVKKNFNKKLSKQLLTLPWRIDYKIKVPPFCDLDVSAGRGNLDFRGVEGVILIKSIESQTANLDLLGGTVIATFGSGKVNVRLNTRSWRGRNVEIQLAKGEMNVQALPNLNADLDLSIVRTGKIENSFDKLTPRDETKFSDTSMFARAGAGGAQLVFTVGDGTLRFSPQ